MTNETTTRHVALIAADHLVGNLWYNMEALPLIVGRLQPDTVRLVIGGPAAMAYSEMCRLMQENKSKPSAGALESSLRQQGFDFDWLRKLQSRITVESLEVLYNYTSEINNAANLYRLRMYCADADKQAQEVDAKSETITANLLSKLAESGNNAPEVEHASVVGSRVRERLAAIKAGNFQWGASTGFKALDKIFQMADGDLIVIAGRPSQGKCLGKGTKVLMFDGSLKNVEDVQVGDKLMGPDSKAKTVLVLGRGQEMMYWIHQSFGISYRVNESHILSLKRSKNEKLQTHGTLKNISVSDALKNIAYIKSRFKGYKAAVEFPEKPLSIDPYFIGLWLGDGTSSKCEVTTIDKEIIDYLTVYANELGATLLLNNKYGAPSYRISWGDAGRGRSWTLQGQMRAMGILNDKHIPKDYMCNSTYNRLQLLAGLLDSDGYYAGNYNNGRTAGNYFEATFKDQDLAEQVKHLCDTLGFRTSINAKHATIKSIGFDCIVYRVRISGDISRIPTKIARKQAKVWTDFRDWTMSGIDIVPDEVDDYYGFEVDGDGLFLLEDMTVTHNSSLWRQIFYNRANEMYLSGEKGQVVMFTSDDTSEKTMLGLACAIAQVDANRIKYNSASPADWYLVEETIARIEALPMYFDETSHPTPDSLYYRCAMLNAQCPIKLAGQDYMQLMKIPGVNDELLTVRRSAEGSKGIGRTLGFPWIALSQIGKEVEKRADKWPTPSDLLYAGEAEADVCAMIMRPEHYVSRGEDIQCDEADREGIALINVGKNKQGDIGMVRMKFTKKHSRFDDLPETERVELN